MKLPKTEIIKELRKQCQISQIELAENLNMKQSTISRIENGLMDPPYSKMRKIFNFFVDKYPELFPDYNTIFQIQKKLKTCELLTNQILVTLGDTNYLKK